MSRAPASPTGHGTGRLPAQRRTSGEGRPASPDRLSVLLIDQEDLVRELAGSICGQPLDLHSAYDAADALFLAGRTCPDVVVLASVEGCLAPGEALAVLRKRDPGLPVVVGVGPGDGEFATQAAALEPAAVIAHPFRPEPLVRLLRSLAPAHVDFQARPLPLEFGRLRIEGTAPDIWLDGVRATLPMREFLLLRYLAERAGDVVSRAEIGEAVWGSAGAGNTVSVHVMRLRRRLGDRDHGPQWITAVRGLGYRFNVPG